MGDYPLRIFIEGFSPLDPSTLDLTKEVTKKLSSSKHFGPNTFPIQNIVYRNDKLIMTCSGSTSSRPCLKATVTIFNIGIVDVPKVVDEALSLIRMALESCTGFPVIVSPVFDPRDVILSAGHILRKLEEITFEKFEKVKEELYRELGRLGVQAGGSLQLKSKL